MEQTTIRRSQREAEARITRAPSAEVAVRYDGYRTAGKEGEVTAWFSIDGSAPRSDRVTVSLTFGDGTETQTVTITDAFDLRVFSTVQLTAGALLGLLHPDGAENLSDVAPAFFAGLIAAAATVVVSRDEAVGGEDDLDPLTFDEDVDDPDESLRQELRSNRLAEAMDRGEEPDPDDMPPPLGERELSDIVTGSFAEGEGSAMIAKAEGRLLGYDYEESEDSQFGDGEGTGPNVFINVKIGRIDATFCVRLSRFQGMLEPTGTAPADD